MPTPSRSARRSRNGRDVRSRAARSTPRSSGSETKRCLRSRMSDPLPERGGRSRRYFTVTPAGLAAIRDVPAQPAAALAGPRRQAGVMTRSSHAAATRRAAAGGERSASGEWSRVDPRRSARGARRTCWTARGRARPCLVLGAGAAPGQPRASRARARARLAVRVVTRDRPVIATRRLEIPSCERSDSNCATPAAAS